MIQQASRILVVEDEADIRDLLCLHLKREGFEVDSCLSASILKRMRCTIDTHLLQLL